jgi:carbonic anhydrase/acetyltransferase-like protein (isoleucine patch superfamily)
MLRTYRNQFPRLGQGVYVDESAVVIGDVEIGDDSAIWPMVVVRGDMHRIRIGKRTNIQDGSILHITHASEKTILLGFPLIIGDNVTVGHGVILHGCTLHNECLIGMGTAILDGAVIESQVIIGAKSLVPPGKILQSGYLYVGSPVVQKRPLTNEEIAFLQYSADNYVRLKNDYL